MITDVSDKNVVAIPDRFASQHGTKPGSQPDWQESDRTAVLTVKVLPNYAAIAASLLGVGRNHLQPDADPVGDLARERAQEDSELRQGL